MNMSTSDACILLGVVVLWVVIDNTIGESIREAWRKLPPPGGE
jgi:hypothetical protein